MLMKLCFPETHESCLLLKWAVLSFCRQFLTLLLWYLRSLLWVECYDNSFAHSLTVRVNCTFCTRREKEAYDRMLRHEADHMKARGPHARVSITCAVLNYQLCLLCVTSYYLYIHCPTNGG